MKNNKILILSVLAFITLSLSACVKQDTKQPNNINPGASSSVSSNVSSASVSYTLEDVKLHASRTDCWTVINAQVYDLSAYIASNEHKPVIVDGCGIDATAMFSNVEKHSGKKAQDLLPGMVIGTLVQ